MDYHFEDINSTTNIIADDVMIHGETDQQHNRHLIQVLNKCRETGLKLNPDKFIFRATEVPFSGHTVSSSGLCADPKKIQSIMNMPPPSGKTQLNSFIGMCNYLMNYLPHLSDVILPLRGLVNKRTQFTWNRTYGNAFNSAKEHIKNACTLQYFEPSEPIVVECDASKTDIGSVLLQNSQPVMYISRALTKTQQRYSNIE